MKDVLNMYIRLNNYRLMHELSIHNEIIMLNLCSHTEGELTLSCCKGNIVMLTNCIWLDLGSAKAEFN